RLASVVAKRVQGCQRGHRNPQPVQRQSRNRQGRLYRRGGYLGAWVTDPGPPLVKLARPEELRHLLERAGLRGDQHVLPPIEDRVVFDRRKCRLDTQLDAAGAVAPAATPPATD